MSKGKKTKQDYDALCAEIEMLREELQKSITEAKEAKRQAELLLSRLKLLVKE